MYRILFLVRSLEIGGAERQMVELVKNMDHSRFDIHIVTFYNRGELRPLLENVPGVRITSIDKNNRWDLISFFVKLLNIIRAYQPHVIQSYLDVPNSFNVLAGNLLGIKTSLGASASFVDFSRYDWTALLVYKTGAFLSHFSNRIIANSNAGEKYNIAHGYSSKKMCVIHNGIDTQTFQPNQSERLRMRNQWEIGENQKVIGLIGRIDPMKDHPTFLNAAAQVTKQFPDSRFICIGRGPIDYLNDLKTLANSLLERDKLTWIQDCDDKDMAAAYNAFDILVSSSYGEGLAVVIGEGMACGIPCVATDVGDSAFAIGDTGLIVPSKNPSALADSICTILQMSTHERVELGRRARQRVLDHFSIEKMASAYETAFSELAG